MKSLLLLGFFFSLSSALASHKIEDQDGIHVLQMDEDFPIEELQQKNLTIHPLSEIHSKSETLPVSELHKLFQKSGLSSFVQGWSGLELDLLALRCEKQEPQKVVEKYEKKIPLEAIEKFKSLAIKYRMERDQK
jgi:hypothetical protein